MSIHVEAAGTDYSHVEDYELDRPGGYGKRYVLIFFLTPCYVRDATGMRPAGKGEGIIYAPGFSQYNRGDGELLRNHWLHLQGTSCAKLLKDCGLPLNTVFVPGEWGFIAPSLNEIRLEIFQDRNYKNEILQRLAEVFIFRLGRGCSEREATQASSSEIAHLEGFRNLRGMMLSRFKEEWTIDLMAGQVNLSRSRFCFLYKKFFGVSPLSDLINCRLEQSRDLLVTTDFTVEAVAAKCGFASAIHFHRLFKKRFGASPRELCPSEIPYLDPFSENPSPHHNL